MHINMYSCLQWYWYVVQLKLYVLLEGLQVFRGVCWHPISCYILEWAYNKTLLYSTSQSAPYTSNGTPWTVVSGMQGTNCKHCSLIPTSVSNNNLGLFRCGCMCARTLLHIPRHMGSKIPFFSLIFDGIILSGRSSQIRWLLELLDSILIDLLQLMI